MTLDEAIRHAEEVAEYDCYNDEQKKCADEHRQLAEWLRELKRLRESATDADTISRRAAIDTVNELTYPSSLVDVKRKLLQLPSADRPRGEWILQDTSYWRATHAGDVQVNRVNLKCSFCGWRNHEKKKYNYCPNCGAKMVREDGEA